MISWFYCHIEIIIDVIGNIILFTSVAFLIGKAAWEWDDSYSFIEDRKKAKREIDKWTEPVVKILLLIWAKRLRIIYVIFASVILYYLFELFLKLRFQLFVDITNLEDNDVRNLALAFLGTISGLGALFGVYLAILKSETNERQTVTAEQGLITDRINKATEGLGKKDGKDPVIEVRLGSLYALERIAQDSLRDHVQIMEILCAYVRQNSPLRNDSKGVREDIQAALTIIGRRGDGKGGKERLKQEDTQSYRIDLSYCNLRSANLLDANLNRAILYKSNMTYTILAKAQLVGARFSNTILTNSAMQDANLVDANFKGAITALVFVFSCDLSKSKDINEKQLDQMFCAKNVDIPSRLKTRPKHWPKENLSYDDFMKKYWKWHKKNKPLLAPNLKD